MKSDLNKKKSGADDRLCTDRSIAFRTKSSTAPVEKMKRWVPYLCADFEIGRVSHETGDTDLRHKARAYDSCFGTCKLPGRVPKVPL